MSIPLVIGRVLLASLFILGGLDKILDPDPSILRMTEVGMPLAHLLIYPVIALELGGGLLVAFARAWPLRLAATALIVHTLAINLLLHPFWAAAPELARIEVSLFFKNIAVVGGLLIVASGGRVPAQS
ncbi:DoxX family protein [uncultured Tateyamaria sp.]|uniref:DoxX family protein n=1 Tax=uncultured Tateyamaria sp. TaxID=455651 RepID=UPI0026357D74|nr:DoxX family protein [uncultured Tateyamaria sp.]